MAGENTDLVEGFARRIGRSIVSGSGVADKLHRSLPDALRGDFGGAGSVAFYHAQPPEDETDAQKAAREAFENGLTDGLRAAGALIVGVEEQGTDPSQIGWYKDHKMSTVDSVDLPGGQLALVFTLGGEKGNFGIKDGASPLPKLPIGVGG